MEISKKFSGKRVLITGGLGFIGSSLAIKLIECQALVTIVDSLIPELGGNTFNIDSVRHRIVINNSDMRDRKSLDELVKDKDYIFHLAGQVSHSYSMENPQRDLDVNCASTINLVESCRHNNPHVVLVYTSTRQVYGIPQYLPVTEDHPSIPIDVNGINKLTCEQYHTLYYKVYGLRSTVLRLTNVYGPRQQISSNRQGFIGIFIRQALKRQTIRVYGDGRQIRDFNYVDDVVEAILLSAIKESCYGNIYNIGSPHHYSLIDVVEMLQEITDVCYEIVPFPDNKKIIDIGDYYGDYSLFHKITGWRQKIDMPKGLRKTIAFYRQNPEEYLG